MLGLKNLAMLPSYFDYIFVHLRQKVRLRPEISPTFLSTLGPNPIRKARPDLQLWIDGSAFNAYLIFTHTGIVPAFGGKRPDKHSKFLKELAIFLTLAYTPFPFLLIRRILAILRLLNPNMALVFVYHIRIFCYCHFEFS